MRSIIALGLTLVLASSDLLIADEPPKPERLRLLVETDAGGDPDDEGSLVRFLLYANEWDVEGIIADRPRTNNQGTQSGLELVQKILKAYGDCHANLVQHQPTYPTWKFLQERTVAGYDNTGDGVNLICRVLTAEDARPIWYANWGSNSGTTSNMLRALERLERELSEEKFQAILKKLHVTRNAEKLGRFASDISLFVDTRNPDRWYHRFAPLTQSAGGCDIRRDIQKVGPLGACYPIPKEGDSLAFIYLIPTGLSDPTQPTWGGWGGRYAPLTRQVRSSGGGTGPAPLAGFYWAAAEDMWQGKRNRDNTLARFAMALQNDFRARMQWSATPDFEKANHEPIPCLQKDASPQIHHVNIPAGESLTLTAAGSQDPDGDTLGYLWFVYPEAGTYSKSVELSAENQETASVVFPSDAVGKTIHIVLQVTDSGEPPLTRYRRMVVTVR